MQRKAKILRWVAVGCCLASAMTVLANTRTWNGSVSTEWLEADNWTGGLPGAGEHVVIPSGTPFAPTIPAGTNPVSGAYASFSVSNGVTVTCLGDPAAVNEPSGGTTNDPHGIGVAFFAGSAVINGTLSAKGKGFPAYEGPGYSYEGASHGSAGGGGVATYGSAEYPTALGSGSGPGPSRSGGGAIRLNVTGDLDLNGTLDVSVEDEARSGAGGSIWITADRFSGNGVLNARGGDGLYPGGGGRIAVYCDTNAFTGVVDVGGGWDTDASATGGIYPACLPGTLVFTNYLPVGSPSAPADVVLGGGVNITLPDPSVTNYWNLTLTSGYVTMLEGSLVISNLTLSTGTRCALAFDTVMPNVDVLWGNRSATDMTRLDITGSMQLDGSSFLFLPALRYPLSGDLNVGESSTLVAVSDLEAVNADSGGMSGNPHGLGPWIRCANATISGLLTADGMGFLPGTGPGYYGNAYSHGGQAGGASLAYTYGKMARPTSLGGNRHQVRLGGGALRLTVDGTLDIDGAITANATTNVSAWASSGGSIWLTADTIRGAGRVSAVGTDCSHSEEYHGGGGGRIALFGRVNEFSGPISVAGGTSVGGEAGLPGTRFYCTSPVADIGAFDSPEAWLKSDYSVNANGVVLTRTVAQWGRSFEWTDDSRDPGGNSLTNTANYVLNNLPAHTGYTIYTNGVVARGPVDSDAFGILAIDDVALLPAVTVFVEAVPEGTMILIR